jgi:hypothetical protein
MLLRCNATMHACSSPQQHWKTSSGSIGQQELKQIMALHGGRFINYYTRDTVTHIICSNLTDAKVKIFERERCAHFVIQLVMTAVNCLQHCTAVFSHQCC